MCQFTSHLNRKQCKISTVRGLQHCNAWSQDVSVITPKLSKKNSNNRKVDIIIVLKSPYCYLLKVDWFNYDPECIDDILHALEHYGWAIPEGIKFDEDEQGGYTTLIM